MKCICLLQEIFCFVLPFILKWIVAALVVSVLVQLFSTLRKKGDHAHSMVVAQIRTLLYEWWQCLFGRAPSNQKLLSTLFRLTGRRRTFHAIASIRWDCQRCMITSPAGMELQMGAHAIFALLMLCRTDTP